MTNCTTRTYWPISDKVNLKQDYLFFTQFNVMLPYLCKKFDCEAWEYLDWLDEEFDLDHAKRIGPILGVSFEKRFADSEEEMCSLSGFYHSLNEDNILPIQIHFLPQSIDYNIAAEFTHDFLSQIAHHGDCLTDGDILTIYRVTDSFDVLVYEKFTFTVLIIPSKVTDVVKQKYDCFNWPCEFVTERDPIKSDLPNLWTSYINRVKYCVSRQSEPTKLAFEIAGWCERQSKMGATLANDLGWDIVPNTKNK